MKEIEIRVADECSDGEYRGHGDPIFIGSKNDAKEYVRNNPPKFPHPYEYTEVSYKKGQIVKRAIKAGIN